MVVMSDEKYTEVLAKLPGRLETQNNRHTQTPIFTVQQRVEEADEDCSDGFRVYDDEWDEVDVPDALKDCGSRNEDLEDWAERKGYIIRGFKYRWEFVQPFFTEAGAKDYIALDGHNLNSPRVYVVGGYRNHEWQAIRRHFGAGAL